MRTTSKLSIKSAIIIGFFLFLPYFCAADETKWIIAAQKFTYSKGQENNSVTDSTAESIPANILENIHKNLIRNIYPDERLERTRYKMRTERQSLYLQLTSEYKKRDAIVLNDYSTAKLKKNIRDEDKKIEEIREKINQNLKEVKQEEDRLEKDMAKSASGYYQESNENGELKSFTKLIRNIFVKEKDLVTQENIGFYNDDVTYLYTPTQEAIDDGYTGYIFERGINSANINTLVTGNITALGGYLSVEVNVYLYPGAKKIASVMEIGSMEDMEFITSSLANQIVPHLTNSMPVDLMFTINPPEATGYKIFIDDVLQNTDGKNIDLQSGVHTIQFACDGYKTAETSYYFEGNQIYQIDVELVELQEATVTFELKKLLEGDVLVNGILTDKIDEKHTQIKINGNQILGEFIAEDGGVAFFYVPKKNYYDGSYVTINPKPFDRDKYIDTRRKWMYGTYSAFMVSLIPFFYTYGNLINQAELYKNRQVKYQEAVKWQNAYNACSVITIVCGVAWGAELVHYLIAANSVLPAKAKAPKKKKSKIDNEELENIDEIESMDESVIDVDEVDEIDVVTEEE